MLTISSAPRVEISHPLRKKPRTPVGRTTQQAAPAAKRRISARRARHARCVSRVRRLNMFRQLLVAIGLLSCAGGVWAQERDDDPIRQFESRVAAYVALHRSVEQFVPTPRVFTDSAEAEKILG